MLNDEITIDDNWITEYNDIDIYYFGNRRVDFENELIKASSGRVKFHLISDDRIDLEN